MKVHAAGGVRVKVMVRVRIRVRVRVRGWGQVIVETFSFKQVGKVLEDTCDFAIAKNGSHHCLRPCAQDKTRQDKTREDKTRQEKTRQDKARQDKTRWDKTR